MQGLLTGRLLISTFFRRRLAAVLVRSLSGFNHTPLTLPGSKLVDIPASITTGYNVLHTGPYGEMLMPGFPDGKGRGTISTPFGK